MKWIGNKIFDIIDYLIELIEDLTDFLTPVFIVVATAVYMFAWLVTWPLRLVLWLFLALLAIITSPFKDFQAFIQENALFFKETLALDKKEERKSVVKSETMAEGISPIIRSADGISGLDPSKGSNEDITDVDIDLNIL